MSQWIENDSLHPVTFVLGFPFVLLGLLLRLGLGLGCLLFWFFSCLGFLFWLRLGLGLGLGLSFRFLFFQIFIFFILWFLFFRRSRWLGCKWIKFNKFKSGISLIEFNISIQFSWNFNNREIIIQLSLFLTLFFHKSLFNHCKQLIKIFLRTLIVLFEPIWIWILMNFFILKLFKYCHSIDYKFISSIVLSPL